MRILIVWSCRLLGHRLRSADSMAAIYLPLIRFRHPRFDRRVMIVQEVIRRIQQSRSASMDNNSKWVWNVECTDRQKHLEYSGTIINLKNSVKSVPLREIRG